MADPITAGATMLGGVMSFKGNQAQAKQAQAPKPRRTKATAILANLIVDILGLSGLALRP